MSEILLLAATGLAREVLAMVRSSGQYDVVGLLDDDEEMSGVSVDGATVLGSIDDATKFTHALLLVCLGSGKARESVVNRLSALGLSEARYATAIDPSVRTPEGCRIGRGSILLQNVTLTASVTLGAHVVAMPGVTFTHDDDVADFATFAAGVSMGGGVRIGRAAYLGMNSSVRERTSVGDYATIGMGAAVLSNVPDGQTWVGVPAHAIERENDREMTNGTAFNGTA
ncbi:acetyltransferase [Pseudarthrobacter sp. N5]|uniref:acetyltransferase n=1 Tax=Pseudarthrobacter sp. N5 TaxID=3418416 RepID=UPI003CEFF003